ncbi:MAG: peptidase M23 [Paracoccaceae bacterium]
MKNMILSALSLMLAGPAIAHDGLHLHPHGVEPWAVALGALGALGLAALIIAEQRK